jgi:hypothetical protein
VTSPQRWSRPASDTSRQLFSHNQRSETWSGTRSRPGVWKNFTGVAAPTAKSGCATVPGRSTTTDQRVRHSISTGPRPRMLCRLRTTRRTTTETGSVKDSPPPIVSELFGRGAPAAIGGSLGLGRTSSGLAADATLRITRARASRCGVPHQYCVRMHARRVTSSPCLSIRVARIRWIGLSFGRLIAIVGSCLRDEMTAEGSGRSLCLGSTSRE